MARDVRFTPTFKFHAIKQHNSFAFTGYFFVESTFLFVSAGISLRALILRWH